MFEKNLNIAYLLDFYGDVLSDRKRRVMDDYYNNDLSLAEIAAELGDIATEYLHQEPVVSAKRPTTPSDFATWRKSTRFPSRCSRRSAHLRAVSADGSPYTKENKRRLAYVRRIE